MSGRNRGSSAWSSTRLANQCFSAPEHVELATGSSFARLEVDQGPAVEVGGVDIKDAFYQISLPESLRPYFALNPIHARDLGISSTVEGPADPKTKVYPTLQVVPMGWSHALWVCQKLHEMMSIEVDDIRVGTRLADRHPARVIGQQSNQQFVHLEYVDNFVALSQRPGLVADLAAQMKTKLNDCGLPTHEVEAGKGLETLGWAFSHDKPEVKVTPTRMWSLRLASSQLLRVGRCSGKTLEKLLGHYTFAGLIRRGFLSVFQASYVYIRKHYTDNAVLWPEVRRELFWASSLLCLLSRHLASEWSNRVYATDASLEGRGVCATYREISAIREVASFSDIEIFRD